jgi:DNA-directed RNA polymerase specialized sigma24 family protein
MHLELGGACKGRKKPSTYKGCGKRRKWTRAVEIYPAVWKSGLFSGKVALLTRHLRPIRSQSAIAHCSVMASPSPLDRCWVVNDSPGSSPIMPDVRAAVERHWPDTQRAAASVLGDETLAAEIMEGAIRQAVAYLADHPPEDQKDVSAVLSRFCRQEVGRRRKERSRLVFIDISVASEDSSSYSPISAAEAAIDAERILRDAPPKVREAMMMRYGSSETWSDVAGKTGENWQAIRRRCIRYLGRIRRELGIKGKSL